VNTSARRSELRREPLEGGEHRPLLLVAQPTIVSLTFDDGWSSQYAVRSILARHGMRGTFYVNSGRVGLPGTMTWNQLFDLAADGNEIGGHTTDHVKLTTVSTREALRQIADDREALMGHGFTVTNFAYPNGDFNTNVEAIVQACGYSSARRAWGLSPVDRTRPNCHKWYPDVAEEILPLNRYAIRTTCLSSGNTVAELKNLVTRAERNGGGWVTLVFHQVGYSAGADNGYFVSLILLRRFLEWLERRADRGTLVLTVRDTLATVRPSAALRDRLSSPNGAQPQFRDESARSARKAASAS
jgi:peptidoglycan/xylan/chitin deacetylase (PgdA/CDA1 family)